MDFPKHIVDFMLLFGFAAVVYNTYLIIKRLGDILASLRRIEKRVGPDIGTELDNL